MGWTASIAWRMFGVPKGLFGRLGGALLGAHGKAALVRQVLAALDVSPGDAVLEVGFGPGVGIKQAMARVGPSGFVAGADPSDVMVDAAARLNSPAVARGNVDLEMTGAARLPFPDQRFDKAFAMYTVELWPDTVAGLREVRRTLKNGGQVLLTSHAGKGLRPEVMLRQLRAAGFTQAKAREHRGSFLLLARR